VLLLGALYDVASSCYLELNNIDWGINVVVVTIIVIEKYSQKLLDCTTHVTM